VFGERCGSISSETVAHNDGVESDTGFSLLVAGKVILLNTQSNQRIVVGEPVVSQHYRAGGNRAELHKM